MQKLIDQYANLSPAQRKLVLKKLQERGLTPQQPRQHELPPLLPAPRDAALPLSFAQQRLWFIDQLSPGNTAYNIFSAVRMIGRLEADALADCLNQVVQRHESLRTTFATLDGQPIQQIAPLLRLALPIHDLRELPAAARTAQSYQQAQQATQTPFDLAHGPLLRATLLRLEQEEHLLLLVMHHSISDGWSIGVLVRELAQLYQARTSGQPAPLPPLPIQYADFAAWQRGWLQGSALEQQAAYWQRQLAGAPTALELPTDRIRPAVQSYRGATRAFRLPAPLAAALRAMGQAEEYTLFMLLLAAFTVLLHRYSGQTDILVGTPIANRRSVELEALIGMFVNTLVMRNDLQGNPTVRELLARVRETTLEAYAHQDMPFEMLVGELGVARDPSRTPLFQVLFILQNTPQAALELPGMTLSPFTLAPETSMFDLTLTMFEVAGGLGGEFQYNTDLFEAATIERMVGHFETLLAGIVAEPSRRIAELPLLTAAEHQLLLSEWNATQQDYPRSSAIHQLFEAQVARTPDAIALVFDDAQLSYRELNRRANQLADQLRALGVGRGALVGICVERSLELVVALLSVLKAGAGYVPLDPHYPLDRLAFMLRDSGAQVLLTQTHLRDQLPAGPQVICLDANRPRPLAGHDTNRASPLDADDLAYVIYTSGSTGTPKGVQIPHGAVTNFLEAMRRQPGLGAQDALLSVTTLSFDIAVLELCLPLIVGARLVLVSRAVAMDGLRLAQLLASSAATCMQATPATWRLLLEVNWRGDPGLKVLCGGEALTRDLANRLAEHCGVLWNMYGPTETTIWSLDCQIAHGSAPITIGRPIANTQVYLLDGRLNPVPVGVPGELYIGGDGLARGYRGRPDLTAERFVPNPFATPTRTPAVQHEGHEEHEEHEEQDNSPAQHHAALNHQSATQHHAAKATSLQPPASSLRPGLQPPASSLRLYSTGDRARYLADGTIEFIGRLDYQVKLRGFRIELGEIEQCLCQHPAIDAAVVVIHEPRTGARQLAAYIVTGLEEAGLRDTLRAFLKTRLPEYMIPALLVRLDSLPRTPNGKIDRRVLPAPSTSLGESDAFVAPQTAAEQALAAAWQTVLGLPQVGIHDNFFAIGGDSLLVLRMTALVRQAGYQLHPQQVFQYQTIAELAGCLSPASAPQAEQHTLVGPVPLAISQRRFFHFNHPEPQHYNTAALYEVAQRLDPTLLEQALRHVLAHHDGLRQVFHLRDGVWQGTLSEPTAAVPFHAIDLARLPEPERRAAIENETRRLQQSFQLSTGPLIQVALFHCGEDQPQRLFAVTHHLITDAVSTTIWMEDLQLAYEQLSRGVAVQLPPKTTSIKQWTERLSARVYSGALQAELDYWLSEQRRDVAQIPLDYPANLDQNTEESARQYEAAFPAAATAALLRVVQLLHQRGIEVADVLLAALTRAFTSDTRQRRLLVQLANNGRLSPFDDSDLSRTVGFLAVHIPALLDLSAATTPAQAVYAVNAQLRAMPNGGIGYGMLRYLSDDRSIAARLQQMPEPLIFFNYFGRQAGNTPGVLRPARESAGATHAPMQLRLRLLNYRAAIVEDQLRTYWGYSQHLHKPSTIAAFAQRFHDELHAIVASLAHQ